jgi:hypothetical protein
MSNRQNKYADPALEESKNELKVEDENHESQKHNFNLNPIK